MADMADLLADLLKKASDHQIEIIDLRKIVKNLARQVRTDRKIIMATQAFTTTLADNLDNLEESVYDEIRKLNERLLAIASDTTLVFEAMGRAALKDDR